MTDTDREARESARLRATTALPRLDELDDHVLLTRSQVALLANLSPKTLANREAAGRPILPVRRVAGLPRYRVADVKQLLRAGDDREPPAA